MMIAFDMMDVVRGAWCVYKQNTHHVPRDDHQRNRANNNDSLTTANRVDNKMAVERVAMPA